MKSAAPAQTRARSKSDLEWKDVPGPSNFDSFSTDSGVGSVATDTSQVFYSVILIFRFLAIIEMWKTWISVGTLIFLSQIQEESRVLTPFLYATFSQPHSLLSCHTHTQKLELSCYDIVLKGAHVNHRITGKTGGDINHICLLITVPHARSS